MNKEFDTSEGGYFTGKTLGKKDVIRKGLYAGQQVGDVISIYGRKSILEILRYYDLTDEILNENHYHKKSSSTITDDSFLMDEVWETTTSEKDIWDDDYIFTPEDYENLDAVENEYYEDEEYGDPYYPCNTPLNPEDDYALWEKGKYKPWIYGE